MEKRGLSHIEVILSFFIFVSFVLFAIYFFSPSKTSRIVDSSLSYTLDEVKKNISVELESFSVILNSSTQGDDLASVEIKGVANELDNKRVRVENSHGVDVNSTETMGEIVQFEIKGGFYEGAETNGKAIVKFSEDFTSSDAPSGTTFAPVGSYRVVGGEKKKVLSEKKILLLNESYYNNYDGLKKEFNLPGRTSFGFQIKLDSGEIIEGKKNIPSSLEVFSRSERMEIIRINGRVEFADLTVKVW